MSSRRVLVAAVAAVGAAWVLTSAGLGRRVRIRRIEDHLSGTRPVGRGFGYEFSLVGD